MGGQRGVGDKTRFDPRGPLNVSEPVTSVRGTNHLPLLDLETAPTTRRGLISPAAQARSGRWGVVPGRIPLSLYRAAMQGI
jgi:hypothetical protein